MSIFSTIPLRPEGDQSEANPGTRLHLSRLVKLKRFFLLYLSVVTLAIATRPSTASASANGVICADLFARPEPRPTATLQVAKHEALASINFASPFTIYADIPNARAATANALDLLGAGNVRGLDNWISSEARALVFYDLLSKQGLGKHKALIAELSRTNVFFSDAILQPTGTFLTYSFEKEGRGKEIAMFYRPPNFTDRTWFDKTDDQRVGEISALKLPYKTFFPASVIAPTELKPDYLGGYSIDPGNRLHKSISWEVAHKAYEISLHRTMSEVREIAQILRETSSFHVHTVFELPRAYPKFREFRTWFKSLNDALYLKGMEEGLHGNEMTGVLNLPEDGGKGYFLGRGLRIDSIDDISKRNTKFYSAGLRAKIYGPASSAEFEKVGIELRDTTRDLDRLEGSLRNLSASVSTRVWENIELPASGLLRLSTNAKQTLSLLKEAGLRPEIASRMAEAEITSAIPLLPLERGATVNYDTGRVEFASADYAARIKRARVTYIDALKALQKEIDDFAVKNVKVERAELEMALRQCLTEWARIAKPSDRFTF